MNCVMFGNLFNEPNTMGIEKNQSFLDRRDSMLSKEGYSKLFTRICQSCGLKDRHSHFWMAVTAENEEGKALIKAHKAKIPPKVIMGFIKQDLQQLCEDRIESMSHLNILDRLMVEELADMKIVSIAHQKRLDVRTENERHNKEYIEEIWEWYQKHVIKCSDSLQPLP